LEKNRPEPGTLAGEGGADQGGPVLETAFQAEGTPRTGGEEGLPPRGK